MNRFFSSIIMMMALMTFAKAEMRLDVEENTNADETSITAKFSFDLIDYSSFSTLAQGFQHTVIPSQISGMYSINFSVKYLQGDVNKLDDGLNCTVKFDNNQIEYKGFTVSDSNLIQAVSDMNNMITPMKDDSVTEWKYSANDANISINLVAYHPDVVNQIKQQQCNTVSKLENLLI